jgi:hypothetical protein
MEHKAPAILQCFTRELELKKQERFSMEESSSPTNTRSWIGMVTDVALLKSSPAFFSSFVRLMDRTCSTQLINIFNNISKIVPDVNSLRFNYLPMKPGFNDLITGSSNKVLLGLGQLQQKEEAAGKMRTFAMVDG